MRKLKQWYAGMWIVLLAVVYPLAATITVTAPVKDDVWFKGRQHVVKWKKNDIANYNLVKIELFFSNDNRALEISGQTENDGVHSFTLPKNIWPFNGYYVKVSTKDNNHFGKSGIITIKDWKIEFTNPINPDLYSLGQTIIVTSPAAGSKLKYGQWLEVKWNHNFIKSYSQVQLELFKPDGMTYVGTVDSLANPIKPNNGSFMTPVALDYHKVGDYKVRVSTPDKKFTGLSSMFSIIERKKVIKSKQFNITSHCYWFPQKAKADWIGCMEQLGSGDPQIPLGYYLTGYENTYRDPTGPCWEYSGVVYRTSVSVNDLYQGNVVVKATLSFYPMQGHKQTLYIYAKDSASDNFTAPCTLIKTLNQWEFGNKVEIDITELAKKWCSGQKPNHGLVIKGADESFGHNNKKYVVHMSNFIVRADIETYE